MKWLDLKVVGAVLALPGYRSCQRYVEVVDHTHTHYMAAAQNSRRLPQVLGVSISLLVPHSLHFFEPKSMAAQNRQVGGNWMFIHPNKRIAIGYATRGHATYVS